MPSAAPVGLSCVDTDAGISMLCCGHALHQACLATYRATLQRRAASEEVRAAGRAVACTAPCSMLPE